MEFFPNNDGFELETQSTVNIKKDDSSRDEIQLYAGTSLEDLRRKVETSNQGLLNDWDGSELYFTEVLEGKRNSAVSYAAKSLSGGARRNWSAPETPVVVEYDFPVEDVSFESCTEIPEDVHLTKLRGQEYFGYQVPFSSIDGVLVPTEGPRIRDGMYIDPEGWEYLDISYSGNEDELVSDALV